MGKIWMAVVGVAGALLLAGCGGAPGERDYRAGVREYARGNYARAMSYFEKAVHQPGGEAHAAAWNYLGCAAWQLRQLPVARSAFESSLHLAPDYSAAQFNLAALHAAAGNASAAIGLLMQVAARAPARSEPLELMGQLYLDRQTWSEARRVLREAQQRAPESPRVLTRLAQAELGGGDAQRAVALLNHALDRDAKYAPALFDLALIYHQPYKDNIQAAVLLRRFLAVAPQDENAEFARQLLADFAAPAIAPLPIAPTSTARSFFQRVTGTAAPTNAVARLPATVPRNIASIMQAAIAEAKQGHPPQAAILFLEAAGRAEREQNPAAQEQTLTTAAQYCFDQARVHAALGRFQLDHGRTEDARRSFKQALALDAKLVPAYLGLAEAAGRTGEYDAALVALKEAVRCDPQNADALWQLAQLYDRALGVADRAAAGYRQFVRSFPGDPRVLTAQERLTALEPVVARTRGRSAGTATPAAPTKQGGAGHKEPVTAAVIAVNPQAAVQAYNRARQYQAQQDWESATAYYKRAIENNPGMANAWFNLGLVYTAKGDTVSARDAYAHAIKIQPDMISARYNLALLLREAHDRNAAIAQLREILRQQPDNAPAYYVLGYIHAADPLASEQAKAAYRKFIELAPNDPMAAGVRDWLNRH